MSRSTRPAELERGRGDGAAPIGAPGGHAVRRARAPVWFDDSTGGGPPAPDRRSPPSNRTRNLGARQTQAAEPGPGPADPDRRTPGRIHRRTGSPCHSPIRCPSRTRSDMPADADHGPPRATIAPRSTCSDRRRRDPCRLHRACRGRRPRPPARPPPGRAGLVGRRRPGGGRGAGARRRRGQLAGRLVRHPGRAGTSGPRADRADLARHPGRAQQRGGHGRRADLAGALRLGGRRDRHLADPGTRPEPRRDAAPGVGRRSPAGRCCCRCRWWRTWPGCRQRPCRTRHSRSSSGAASPSA